MKKHNMTIQNPPMMIEIHEIGDDYVKYKSGSMYETDSDYVVNKNIRKAKLYSLSSGDRYFIDAETGEREFLSSIIFGGDI